MRDKRPAVFPIGDIGLAPVVPVHLSRGKRSISLARCPDRARREKNCRARRGNCARSALSGVEDLSPAGPRDAAFLHRRHRRSGLWVNASSRPTSAKAWWGRFAIVSRTGGGANLISRQRLGAITKLRTRHIFGDGLARNSADLASGLTTHHQSYEPPHMKHLCLVTSRLPRSAPS